MSVGPTPRRAPTGTGMITCQGEDGVELECGYSSCLADRTWLADVGQRLASIDAALALHQPCHAEGEPDDCALYVRHNLPPLCATCSGSYARKVGYVYPCPTVVALTAALIDPEVHR